MLQSINPATGELIAEYATHTHAEVETLLDAAVRARQPLRNAEFEGRAAWLVAAAEHLETNTEELARLITTEMGKPIREARAEVQKCGWVCRYYAGNGADFLAPIPRATDATESYIAFEPLGTVLAVMPWNFPFWQVFRFAAPALMAGNTALLKHASNVTGCALAIEQCFREAGFPGGAFQALKLPSSEIAPLISDARISAVTLTGSEPAGAAVASAAGKAIKKSVLELGGSDAFIVLADADLDAAVKTAVRARNQNTGQSCIAAKRFIVVDSVADDFTRRLGAEVAALKVADPLSEDADVGCLARPDLLDDIDQQVRSSVEAGATVVVGGVRVEGKGSFYQPTVLADVRPGMAAFDEETFGPVAAVVRAKDAGHAVELANLSQFGLGCSLWTADIDGARRLASRIEAGAVFVNGMVASDPRLPFGGVKRSGYGRELSEFGIREFVNIQAVWIGPKRD